MRALYGDIERLDDGEVSLHVFLLAAARWTVLLSIIAHLVLVALPAGFPARGRPGRLPRWIASSMRDSAWPERTAPLRRTSHGRMAPAADVHCKLHRVSPYPPARVARRARKHPYVRGSCQRTPRHRRVGLRTRITQNWWTRV